MSKPLFHPALSAAADTAPAPQDALNPDDIHRQLERILASDQFRDSLRLTRFLTFVIETALAGKADCIKAYTIAVEALGRGSDFDPQDDPIVRVEAGRLRQALARYYAGAGRDDPLLIDLPRGCYVPSFRRRTEDAAPVHRQTEAALPNSAMPAKPGGFPAEQSIKTSGGIQPFDQNVSRYRDGDDSGSLSSGGVAPPSASLAASEGGESQTRLIGTNGEETGAPSFRLHPERPEEAPPVAPRSTIGRLLIAARERRPRHALKYLAGAIIILAILEVLFDIDHPLTGGPNHGLWYKLWPVSDEAASQARRIPGEPIIYVEPLTSIGQRSPDSLSPEIIRERLTDALARYDDVTVLARQAEPQPAVPAPPSASGALLSSHYRLATTVQYLPDGSVLLVAKLIDTADDTIAWSKGYTHTAKPDPNRHNGRVSPDVARSLLAPFGVVQARERVKRAVADPMHDPYRCILDANVYLSSFDPSLYQPVHDCLIRATSEDPPAVTVFADLAFVYLRNYRFGIFAPPGDRTALDNAYAMAARAVDIKPNSAFAQYALQEVSLAQGDIARAKIAGDNSFRLNPSNGAIAFGHASLLILTGQTDAGLALLDENAAKSPHAWIGYHMLMALGRYLKGDLKTAGTEAGQIANPFFPLGLVLDALVANKAGDRTRAQQDIAMLYQFYPAWRNNYRSSIARFLPDPAMADRIAADFKAAVDATQ